MKRKSSAFVRIKPPELWRPTSGQSVEGIFTSFTKFKAWPREYDGVAIRSDDGSQWVCVGEVFEKFTYSAIPIGTRVRLTLKPQPRDYFSPQFELEIST